MANRAKAKGSAWEKAVTDMLKEEDIHADRMPAGATLDRGDISVKDWTVECKNQQTLSLGSWLDETVREQENGKTRWHALLVKRKGKGKANEGFVVMTGQQWTEIVDALQAAEHYKDVIGSMARQAAKNYGAALKD